MYKYCIIIAAFVSTNIHGMDIPMFEASGRQCKRRLEDAESENKRQCMMIMPPTSAVCPTTQMPQDVPMDNIVEEQMIEDLPESQQRLLEERNRWGIDGEEIIDYCQYPHIDHYHPNAEFYRKQNGNCMEQKIKFFQQRKMLLNHIRSNPH